MTPRSALPILLVCALPILTSAVPRQEKTAVAVLRFDNNTGDDKYQHLGRALSAMLISDLSVLDQIQLVERDRIEDLTSEMKLQQSGYVDPATAQTVGMMVGAQYVVTGAFAAVDPEMRLDTRIDKVETSEIVHTADVTGQKNSLFDLEQQLADSLVSGLSLVLSDQERAKLREQQEANRIDDLETMLAFSRALCLVDGGDYVDGVEELQKVKDAAPGSALVGLTLEHVKERAASDAKNELKSRANKALGGLLGRKKSEPVKPKPSC